MMKRAFILATVIMAFAVGTSLAQTVINYPNQTLHPSYTATGFDDVWDLTQGDLVLSYTIDMTGISQPAPWQTSYTEVGIREMGAGNFNPGPFNTYQGGKGGWMTSLVGDLTPSPTTLSLHDKHNLAASGGRDEQDYDATDPGTVVAPFGTYSNYGLWFDRDGVDPFQALLWGAVDGTTYNTGGIYHIVVTYHAISSTLATMFATINGIPTGFYTAGWKNAQPDIYPAGLSFKGDMSKMQAFAGLWAPNSSFGDVVLSDITVSGYLNCKFNFVFLADKLIKIDGNKESDGALHSNGDIEFHKGKPGTHTGNLTAVRDITIETRNTIDGDATAGDELYVEGNATVTGAKADHAAVAAIPLPVLSFSAGGPSHDVPAKGSLVLDPGSYDRVKIRKKAKIYLRSGDYYFNEFDTDKGVEVHFDVALGPVNVNIVKELEIDDKVDFIISSGDIGSSLVNINTMQAKKIDIGKNSRILGSFVAPNTEVHFSRGCAFRGSVCAEKITVEKKVPFQQHNSPNTLPKPARDENEEFVVEATTLPTEYSLAQNYPNPFNPSTTIDFALPEAGNVTLNIYNSTGQLVRSLVSRSYNAGRHSISWDARDENGSRVASGVYLYEIKANNFVAHKKLVLTK